MLRATEAPAPSNITASSVPPASGVPVTTQNASVKIDAKTVEPFGATAEPATAHEYGGPPPEALKLSWKLAPASNGVVGQPATSAASAAMSHGSAQTGARAGRGRNTRRTHE